ncbi:hypothetical protein Tco_0293511, partial [Tanacetum coccineum]
MPSSKQYELYIMGIKNEEDINGKWSMGFSRRNKYIEGAVLLGNKRACYLFGKGAHEKVQVT